MKVITCLCAADFVYSSRPTSLRKNVDEVVELFAGSLIRDWHSEGFNRRPHHREDGGVQLKRCVLPVRKHTNDSHGRKVADLIPEFEEPVQVLTSKKQDSYPANTLSADPADAARRIKHILDGRIVTEDATPVQHLNSAPGPMIASPGTCSGGSVILACRARRGQVLPPGPWAQPVPPLDVIHSSASVMSGACSTPTMAASILLSLTKRGDWPRSSRIPAGVSRELCSFPGRGERPNTGSDTSLQTSADAPASAHGPSRLPGTTTPELLRGTRIRLSCPLLVVVVMIGATGGQAHALRKCQRNDRTGSTRRGLSPH